MIFPANDLTGAKNLVFRTNHWAATSKTIITTTKWRHTKQRQQLTKTTNTSKTKPDETKSWVQVAFYAILSVSKQYNNVKQQEYTGWLGNCIQHYDSR